MAKEPAKATRDYAVTVERGRCAAALDAWEKDDNALDLRKFVDEFRANPPVNADNPSERRDLKADLDLMAKMMDEGYVD